MKKRILAILIGILVLTLSFGGCGGTSSEVDDVDADSIDEELELNEFEAEPESDDILEEEELPPEEEPETEDPASQGSLEAVVASGPVSAYLGTTLEEIESTFGSPSMEDFWRGSYFLLYEQEDLLFYVDSPESDKIIGVGIRNYQNPGQHHFLGLDRGITFDETRERLGEPDSEGVDENDEVGGYHFSYSTERHTLGINGVDDTPGFVGYVELFIKFEYR